MTKKFRVAALIERAVVETLETRKLFAAGVLDSSFDGDGKLFRTAGVANNFSDVLVQTNGKVLGVGQIAPSPARFAVLRFTQAGALDTSFGGGDGIADLPTNMLSPIKMASDSLGRVVVAGATPTATADCALTVLRFDVNGNLDTTFNGTGSLVLPMGALRQINAIAIQNDDKIVLGGAFQTTTLDFGVIRLTTTGGLDSSFDGDGSAIVDTGGTDAVTDLSIFPNGAILAAGYTGTDWAFLKFTTTGGRFGGFGVNGMAVGPSNTTGAGTAVVTSPDGAFYAAGSATSINPNTAAAVGRFTISGKPDPLWGGGDGMVDVQTGTRFTDIALQPDGKFVVAGSVADFTVARYLANGNLDSTFGTGGSTNTDMSGTDAATSVTLAPDGRVVVGGSAGGVTQPAIARYTSNGIVNQQADGTLKLNGSDAVDNLIITAQTNGYLIDLNGAQQSIPGLKAQLNIALLGGNDTITINGFTAGVMPPMSIDMGAATDKLVINGTTGDDTFDLFTGGFRGSAGESFRTFNNTVESIEVHGLSGSDTITAGGSLPKPLLDGGADGDNVTVAGALAGTSVTLQGGDGDDQLFIDFNSPAIATLDGGIGTDRATYEGTANNDVITLTPTGISGRSFTQLNLESLRVRGQAGNDTITAPTGLTIPVTINAGDNDDIIKAKNSTIETIDGGNGNDHADVDANDVVSNVEFFDFNLISGSVFNDTNADGVQGAGEVAVAGRTIYIDANNSGGFDLGETSVVSTSSGYTFSGLGAQTYTIRQVLPAGWDQTTPAGNAAWTVTLSNNTPQTGKNFGSRTTPAGQAPFFGVPFTITTSGPTTIQAEDFDEGGEGVAYHDVDSVNSGGQYRSTGVDVETSPSGFDVGYIKAGEWLEYTVAVTAGTYDLQASVASLGTGGTFHVEFNNGTSIVQSGAINVANTGNWQVYTTTAAKRVTLAAGQQVMRVFFDSNGSNGNTGNLDWLKLTPVAAPGPTQTLTNTIATFARDGGPAAGNFGSNPTLEVKKSTNGFNRESFLQFDLSSVATISNAKLQLFGSLSDNTVPSIATSIYSSTNTAWNENTLTYNNRPGVNTLLGAINVSGTTGATYELDITAFLQAEKAAGRNVVTIVLRNNTQTIPLTSFSSDDAGVNQPQIVITT